jgi:hypothetical protein
MPSTAPNPPLDQPLVAFRAWRLLAAMAVRIAETTRGDDVLLRTAATIPPRDQVLACTLKASREALGNAVTASERGRLIKPNRSATVEAVTALTNESGASGHGE